MKVGVSHSPFLWGFSLPLSHSLWYHLNREPLRWKIFVSVMFIDFNHWKQDVFTCPIFFPHQIIFHWRRRFWYRSPPLSSRYRYVSYWLNSHFVLKMAYNPLIQMLSFVLYSTPKICIIYIIFVPDYKK